METVTLDMVYHELKRIQRKLAIVEHAIIPTVKLEPKELQEHQKDLQDALSGPRVNLKDL